MSLPTEVTEKFEAVLEQERLVDRSLFDAPGFFDELPLYSRYTQIEFLNRYGNADELLIQLSLDYLESVVERRRSHAECFAAITIRDQGDQEHVVPYIFLCNGWVTRRLKPLRLTPPTSELAKSLRQSLDLLSRSSKFALAQDTISSPGNTRVFIALRRAPTERVLTLGELLQIASGTAGTAR
ncbi:MAG TPA: hypothetical protein VFI31_27385 [Pirellulales bacterium]|nr:hypothetical protein [Pirellulales bacterium]